MTATATRVQAENYDLALQVEVDQHPERSEEIVKERDRIAPILAEYAKEPVTIVPNEPTPLDPDEVNAMVDAALKATADLGGTA
jgi:hypothetical protein